MPSPPTNKRNKPSPHSLPFLLPLPCIITIPASQPTSRKRGRKKGERRKGNKKHTRSKQKREERSVWSKVCSNQMSIITGDDGSFSSENHTGEEVQQQLPLHRTIAATTIGNGSDSQPPPPAVKKKRNLPGTPGMWIFFDFFFFFNCLTFKLELT